MDYLGHTQTATYLTGPKLLAPSPHALPTIANHQQPPIMTNDTYPAPSPLRRAYTTLPWRPSTFYQTAKVNTTQPLRHCITDPMSPNAQVSGMDALKVPPIFASARNALYTRYTPNEWESSNHSNYNTADWVRNGSERLRLNSVRLCKEADDKTKRAQGDVGKRLGERVGDVVFWRNELENELDGMINEISNLNEAKRMMEKCLLETENPLHIAQECLYQREKRQGIDLVHDAPEKHLIKEVDVIKRCQDHLRHTIDKTNAQLSLDRAAQHELEKDAGDKFIAQNLDESAHQMKNTSRGLAYHNGVEKIDNTVSVPETWAMYTNNNIQRSQKERAASRQLRNEIDSVLTKCANDMWRQWNAVNLALTDRIKETTDARNKIQAHLSKVLQEIFDMNKNIEFIKKSIQDKQPPLMVAQSRLDTRLRRPNVESCRDSAQHRLVEEVNELYDTIQALQQKLRQAENSMQELQRTKTALEEDLAIKNNTLFIDHEKCLAMRKTFPMTPICGVRIKTENEVHV